MSRSSLCPGYKQVDAFGPDADYEHTETGEIEEEVTYVTLDLGSVEPTLVPSSSAYRLIGLDTPTPFLQLSGTIFQGKHQNLLGTELLFTEEKDSHDPSKKSIVHVSNTEQRIRFREVELKRKTSETEQPQTSTKGKGKEPVVEIEQGVVDLLTGIAREATPEVPPKRRGGRKSKAQKEAEHGAARQKEGEGAAGVGLDEQPSGVEPMDMSAG
ncbi:hypothetical protein BV25DRAFT_194013 [Artomyces pyxidatus]|uniref:Uncharacterized protein n=1 Tax=Artomyces pyxidatus TaxID=48021 RepID=A0ACB8T9B1_9AGAM|nr:hypothetical protein BV25DRAFT_194013 [Artomyces pyxidatus]